MYMYMEISIVATFVNNCDNLHQKYTIYFTRIITTPLSTYIIIVEDFSKHFKDCFGYIGRVIVTAFVLLYYWVNLLWQLRGILQWKVIYTGDRQQLWLDLKDIIVKDRLKHHWLKYNIVNLQLLGWFLPHLIGKIPTYHK